MKVNKVIFAILFCLIMFFSLTNIVKAQNENIKPEIEYKFVENTLDGNLNKYFIDQEREFGVSILPVIADDDNFEEIYNVSFTIEDTSIARITKAERATATVKFIKAGKTKITATSKYQGKTYKDIYYFEVIRNSDELYDLYITGKNIINEGETSQLKLTRQLGTTTPVNITSEATWSTDNENIATVNDGGLVTGISGGEATITASYNGRNTTYKVNVNPKTNEESTKINFLHEGIGQVTGFVLNKEYGFILYLYNIPDTEKENIKITIDDENIAKLKGIDLCNWEDGSGKGMIIANTKLLSLGKTKITATLNYNGKTYSDSYDFEVLKSIYALSLFAKEYNELPSNLEVGNKIQLTAMLEVVGSSLLPNDVTSKGTTWTSSNEKIAKVDSKGLVTAIGEGTVTITANYKAGDETVTTTYNLKIIDSTKSPINSNNDKDNSVKNDDPTTSKSPLPQAGEYATIIITGITLAIILSIIMYKKYNSYKGI